MKPVITLCAVALMIAPAGLAQVSAPPGPDDAKKAAEFIAADKNKDGKLDKAEWSASLPASAKAHADEVWGRMDADKKGFVTKDQFVAFKGQPIGAGTYPPTQDGHDNHP
jgi:hypothetical protein